MDNTESAIQQQLGFDYNSLSEEDQRVVKKHAAEIRTRSKRAAEDIVEIGKSLIEVKHRLGHGRFLPWLESEF